MKKLYFLIMLVGMSLTALSQPVNIFATGAGGSFITGNSTAAARADGNIVTTGVTRRGYAVFDLSTLPADAVITSVTINFNVITYAPMFGGGAGGWATYGFAGDLSTVVTAAALFPDMVAGTLLSNATYGAAAGNRNIATSAASVNFIQTQIGNKISICWTGGGTKTYTITGEAGAATAGGAHAPYLTINYTLCTAPTAVTASAVPNPICTGSALDLTGGATGATNYTWAGPGGYTATGLSQSVITTASSAGVYTLTAINNCGPVSATATAATSGITLYTSPVPNTGPDEVCHGSTVTLVNTTGSGVWSSSNTGIATVTPGGLVTGVAGGTATISYSIPATGCSARTVVTVDVPAAAITGPPGACVGTSTTLNDASPGGTWTSSNTAVATVTPVTGVVTGVTVGTTVISYAVGTCGPATLVVTVHPLPAIISGPETVCTGTTVTLSDFTTGGTWISSTPAIATIDSELGIVSGLAVGAATITYQISGCFATAPMAVNQSPAPIIATDSVLCQGSTLTFGDPTAFGGWSSSAGGIAGVTIAGVVSGVSEGMAVISYTLTGCSATQNVTVTPLPAIINGPTTVCTGAAVTLTDGVGSGTWSSSDTTIAKVDSTLGVVTGVAAGVATISYTIGGCSATAPMTVNASPDSITGPTSVCQFATITLADVTGGDTWSSTNNTIATVGPAGIVTGVLPGVDTILYTVATTACFASYAVTVNLSPSVITGSALVCIGSSVTLTDSIAGGTWSSSNTAIATVDSTLGIVTGVTAGAFTITYSIGGCLVTFAMTDNTPPAAITGPVTVCQFGTITLASTPLGDTWTSTNTNLATVDPASGVVTGVLPGSDTILYTDPATTCFVTYPVTVNLAPSAITGSALLCIGSTITYLDSVAGGTWSSSDNTVATIDSTLGIATGLAVGTPTISYTITAGGCFALLNIAVNDTPATSITGTTAAVCAGSTITLTEATGGDTWSSTQTGIATIDPATGIVTGVMGGLDTILYTDPATTCFVSYPITVNLTPSVITGSTGLICTGSTYTLMDSLAGGTWSSSDNTVATIDSMLGIITGVEVTPPATAVITYTMPTGCIATLSVTDNDTPATITGLNVVCQFNTITLTDATAGDTWTSTQTGIATIDPATGIVTGVLGGVDTILYTNTATTCFVSFPVTVNPGPDPILGQAIICTGSTFSYTDGTGAGTWSSSDGTIATIDSIAGTVTGEGTGTATLTYTISLTGCFVTFLVTDNPPPGAIVASDTLVCTGLTITLTEPTPAPGGFWTSSFPGIAGVDAGTGIVTGNSAGVTTITYTDPTTTCIATIQITDVDPPTAISGFSNQVCEQGTIVLTDGQPGGTWTSTSTANATVDSFTTVTIVSGVLAGIDTIDYTILGCPSATFPITVNPTPPAILGPDSVCVASSTILSDAIAGGTWSSSNSLIGTIDPTSGIITGVAAGLITVTYTLPAGCDTIMAFTVNPLPLPIGTTTTFVVCQGSTITLTEVTTGGTWSSSNTAVASVDSVTGIVTGESGGTTPSYANIIYTLPTSCFVVAPVTVDPLPAPIAGPTVVCVDATIPLTNTTPGGTWSSGNTSIATVDFLTGVVTGVSASTVTITYAITTGCISTVIITVNPIPAAIFGVSQVCSGSTITLSDATGGGLWSSSNTAVTSVVAGLVSAGVGAGVTNISYTLPATSCFVISAVTVNPLPSAITGALPLNVCEGRTTTLSDTDPGGTWSSSNTATATVDLLSGVATGVAAGGVNIIYTLPTGCSIGVLLTVLPSPVATVTAGGPLTFCAGGNVVLTGPVVAGDTYQWYNDSVAIPLATMATYIVTTDGAYTLSVTNVNGCTDTSGSVVVHAEITPVLTFSGDTAFCYGNNLLLTVSAGGAVGVFTYQWLVNGAAIPGAVNSTYAAIATGVYTCIVNTTGPSGICTDTSNAVNILVHPLPVAHITDDGATLSTPGGFTAYQWFLNMVGVAGATSNTYTPVINGSYRVLVVDSFGCDGYSNAIAMNSVGVGIVNKTGVKIYPNPTTGMVHIESPVKVRAVVTDVEGKKLLEQEDAKDIDISDLAGGLYLITLYDENGDRLMMEKMVKD